MAKLEPRIHARQAPHVFHDVEAITKRVV